MKKIAVIIILSWSILAQAFEIGGVRITQCGQLRVPKAKAQEGYNIVKIKLEECLANNLACHEYVWPREAKLSNGEPLTTQQAKVNLWSLAENLKFLIECAEMMEDNPNVPSGIADFSN